MNNTQRDVSPKNLSLSLPRNMKCVIQPLWISLVTGLWSCESRTLTYVKVDVAEVALESREFTRVALTWHRCLVCDCCVLSRPWRHLQNLSNHLHVMCKVICWTRNVYTVSCSNLHGVGTQIILVWRRKKCCMNSQRIYNLFWYNRNALYNNNNNNKTYLAVD